MCKAAEHLIFCTCQPHELPQKLKAANLGEALISGLDETAVYHWSLSRKAVKSGPAGASIIGSIRMPEDEIDEHLHEEDILKVLNSIDNCFDFSYEAQNDDCLKIFSNSYSTYMSFVFNEQEQKWFTGIVKINDHDPLQSGSLLLQ